MHYSKELRELFSTFKEPWDIQVFLNSIPYNPAGICKSPKKVCIGKKAHCFEGSLFAAAALSFLGYKPLLVDMMADNDDDHVIAVFKRNGLWGAVAKSNTTTLRYREPVYRTIREMIMSYFEGYFNTNGEKTLRSYSMPFSLLKYDKGDWMNSDETLDYIGEELGKIKHYDVVPKKLIKTFSMADPALMKACFLFSVDEGLYKPK